MEGVPGDVEVLAGFVLVCVKVLEEVVDVDFLVLAEVEKVFVSLRDDVQEFEAVHGLF